MMSLCIAIKFSRTFKIKYPVVVILPKRDRDIERIYSKERNKDNINNGGKRKSLLYIRFLRLCNGCQLKRGI